MRTTTGSHRNTPSANTQGYSPSVPLSVYRQLACELQAHQTKLDVLTTQNQQLVQENQLLRKEIAKAVESILRLQKLVDSQTPHSARQTVQSSEKVRTETKRLVNQAPSPKQVSHPRSSVVLPDMEIHSSIPEPLYIEEQEASYYLDDESEPKEINSWLLIIAILFIIVMGFGAGYLIVRPLLQNQSR